ncbi:hypothetical protein B0T21DRAFT_402566 [Apiosordaria backusii]|uniref:Uncharacterized protein n=1 Tax=Apiosordaria backusii TaxID=314023 RepID=A0AA40BDT6_9PEZI|nr:hypothetical protein B0T21DRAFT_402566 [Apiosordaria backusii]
MHISRTVLTTIALAATGSALPALSCGSGTCPHNGGGNQNRLDGGDNQGTQQGQQGQQHKTSQNGDGGLTARTHTLHLAGQGADSGNQMGGTGNTGLYDKSGNYLGKNQELDRDKLRLSTTPSTQEQNQGLNGEGIIRYSKQQQFQPRSEISAELRKTNDGQQQQRQGPESGQLMTTLDKIRELLFGPQQQQQLERQQEGKDNSHIRRSEIQGQGSMGSGQLQGQAGRFESGTYSQSGLGQEQGRRLGGLNREQPLLNNAGDNDGITASQTERQRLDHGNGQAQWSAGKQGDNHGLIMRDQDVPKIVITQHEQVQPRGQGQSSSKGSGSTSSEETDSSKFAHPARMLKEQEGQTMKQDQEKPIATNVGIGSQLLDKGDSNNLGRLAGRSQHTSTTSSTITEEVNEKNDGGSGTSEEEEGEDQKAEKLLGSDGQGLQWGQTEAELKKCLLLAGQQGDISMLRDCFNNDAGKTQA